MIRIHTLTLEYRQAHDPFNVASGVGILCKIDPKTLNLELGIYTRVLVEVDLAKPLPGSILVTMRRGDQNIEFFVEVSYEKLPHFCNGYGLVSNQFSKCRNRVPQYGGMKELSQQKSKSQYNSEGAPKRQPHLEKLGHTDLNREIIDKIYTLIGDDLVLMGVSSNIEVLGALRNLCVNIV